MEGQLFLIIIGLIISAMVFWNLGKNSEHKRMVVLRREEEESVERQLKKDLVERLDKLREESVLLPSLVRWADQIDEIFALVEEKLLTVKKRPAVKAAEKVVEAKKEMREAKYECELARNRVDLYESLAPWLAEYTDISLDDLIMSVRESKTSSAGELDDQEDPITQFVSKTGVDWRSLSGPERNQLALDRYSAPNRKRSLWQIGIDFERYVGYHYEEKSYKVRFNGALQAKEDLGIDLICENDKEILIIQCKRLSLVKGLPVRENTVAQIYGAAKFFEWSPETILRRLGVPKKDLSSKLPVRPVLITTYELSEDARLFAKALNVEIIEHFRITPYPLIKCNVAPRNGDKIYHLPMDQQYDRVVIGDQIGECYVETVAEAERLGFRRAFRWKGDGVE